MSYQRVIPRDLFNESKLLKCIGQLALIIHDGLGVPRDLKLNHDDSEYAGFQIEQNQDSGALYCANIQLTFAGQVIELSAPYNSKEPYPLNYTVSDDEDGRVFTDDGKLSHGFIVDLKTLQRANAHS